MDVNRVRLLENLNACEKNRVSCKPSAHISGLLGSRFMHSASQVARADCDLLAARVLIIKRQMLSFLANAPPQSFPYRRRAPNLATYDQLSHFHLSSLYTLPSLTKCAMADTSHPQEVSRSRRGFNLAFRRTAPTEEQERLLSDEEQQAADADGESCSSSQMAAQEQPCAPNPYAHLPVYTTIHR